MGKKDFATTHYLPAKKALGVRPTVKISYFSDAYESSANFAGVIMYHWRGQFQWYNSKLGYKGRSFYVAILNTGKWPEDAFRAANHGMVHDYIFERTFGECFSANHASVGGFAVLHGELRYSSVWLNERESTQYAHHWQWDKSKLLSEPEQALVRFAVEEWKQHGTDHVCHIPDGLDRQLSGGAKDEHRAGCLIPIAVLALSLVVAAVAAASKH